MVLEENPRVFFSSLDSDYERVCLFAVSSFFRLLDQLSCPISYSLETLGRKEVAIRSRRNQSGALVLIVSLLNSV